MSEANWRRREPEDGNGPKERRVKAFCEFLKSEGYLPTIDGDSDIVFKVEGKAHLVLFEDRDESYLRIVFPNFWSIDDQDERQRVEAACIKICSSYKSAKVYPVRDNTCASVELFSSSIQNSTKVFERCMSALQAAVEGFVEEMRKERE